jgi:outer membrane immunogenic protein
MLRKSCIASLVLAGVTSLSTGARADGENVSLKDVTAAPAEQYVWDGFYVGVGIGAGSFDHNVDIDASKSKELQKRHKECVKYSDGEYLEYRECIEYGWSDWETKFKKVDSKSASSGDDDWDIFGTAQIGYDRLLHSRVLIGAFADFDFYQDADHSFSEPWIEQFRRYKKEVGSIDGDIELDHVWSIGGKVGFLLTPCIALYGVGGYTEASLDGSVDVTFKNHWGKSTVLSMEAPDDLNGYFVGAGGEVKLKKNVSLKFEYRYSEFDGESASASGGSVSNPFRCGYYKECRIVKDFDAHADFDTEIQSVRAVLVLKFDEPERAVASLK